MINLLPPEEKRELLSEKRMRIIVILWVLILFFFFSLILILVSARIYLQIQVLSQKGFLQEVETESKQPEMKNLKEEISSINQTLIKLESFYSRKIYFSKILERISGILPEEVYLTNFSATLSGTEEKPILKISLSGFSPTREVLFEFREELGKEADFKDVDFPSANWVKATDIDFLVSFNISP